MKSFDKRKLLERLRDEALLTEARARGALKAYLFEALEQARDECNLKVGTVVCISYADGKKRRAKIAGSDFHPWQEEPSFFGYFQVKSKGGFSTGISELFTIGNWRAGFVKVEPSGETDRAEGDRGTAST